MNMPYRPPAMTVDEFEQMSDNKGFELIDGQLREKGMGAESSEIQSELGFLIRLWDRDRGLGKVYESECMYRCFPVHPNRVRKPDVSFVRLDRLPDGRSPIGIFTIRPDLAIEVVSPGDTVYDLDEKLDDYRSAGVPLVWVLHPNRRVVRVSTPDGSSGELTEEDTLTGDPVLPGFSVRVADLFPPPAPAQA